MRGATRATVGSQKWPSRASSQPRRGATSESRNATKSVVQAARPVLRAAAGPLLRGWRSTSISQCAPAKSSGSIGERRTVVHHDDAQSAQRAHQTAHTRNVVPHRNYHGHVAVRRATRGPGMRHRGIQQGAGQLRADLVAHLQPAVGQHVLGGGCQLQQPGRRATQQGRAVAEHPHATIDLDGESVGQSRLELMSASRRDPGDHRATRRAHPSTISAKMRLPSAAVAVVGSPSTPTAADRRDSPAAHRREQFGQRRAVPGEPPVGQHVGRRNMQQHRCFGVAGVGVAADGGTGAPSDVTALGAKPGAPRCSARRRCRRGR